MKPSYRILTLVAAAAFAWAAFSALPATEEMASRERMKCAACHDKAGSKLLTSRGKYYELKGTMDGHDEIVRKFRKCTSCHAKEPGSLKLTPRGERFKGRGLTMEHVAEFRGEE